MSSSSARWLPSVALAACAVAGCQHDVSTLFPEGLEPLPDDGSAGAIAAPIAEALVTTNTTDSMVRVYGHGYIFAPVATVWAAAHTPSTLIATCSTDAQSVTQQDEAGYQMDFLVHYTVNNILTIEWDDQYRGDIIATGLGSAEAPGSGGGSDIVSRTMIRHQKTMGSSFIMTSEGTTQMFANADDTVTELQFVEHLAAVQQPVDQVTRGMQHEFDSLLSLSHGGSANICPP